MEMRIVKNRDLLVLSLTLMVVAAFLLLASWSNYQASGREDKKAGISRIVQVIGISSLALTTDCTATRSLVEGICGCLGDIPGGYCYHTACDVVANPGFLDQDLFRLTVDKVSPAHGGVGERDRQ